MYINDNTQEQKNYYTLKTELSNKSIPANGAEIIDDVWYLIHTTPKPTYNVDTQRVVSETPIKTSGSYNEVWSIGDLTQQEIDDKLANDIENGLNQVDASCSEYILSYWSGPAQSNASMGLYDQETCELCKTEISTVLADNVTHINTIETLTSGTEISTYIGSIVRPTISGRVI